MTDIRKLSDIADVAEMGGPSAVQVEMDQAARAEMARAAQAVALLPPEQRARWVTYFFEALDGALGEAVFTDLVGDVMLALGDRLQWGLW